MKKKNIFGFTLIELMIVVAIVGILAMIAYPSYLEHIARSRRADAKSVLLEGAQFMERIYTERGAYNKDSSGAVQTSLADVGFPSAITSAPKDSATKYYNIVLNGDLTATAFTLAATPTGAQAQDKCGTLTLTNAGAKNITSLPVGSTATSTDCWNR